MEDFWKIFENDFESTHFPLKIVHLVGEKIIFSRLEDFWEVLENDFESTHFSLKIVHLVC